LQLATPNCPVTREEVYITGSAPTQLCEVHTGHGPVSAAGSFLSHIFGGGSSKPPQSPGDANSTAEQPDKKTAEQDGTASATDTKAAEKKKSPLQKIFGIFGDKKKKEPDKPVRDQGDSP
jgi:hypothetical protein